ncbi:MAG: hypothetical protein WCO60_18335 [Verrucomicrobiota bacterium]
MRPIIFANLTTRSATTEIAASAPAYIFPACVVGDKVGFAVRCFEAVSASSAVERFVGVRSLRASIGLIDTAPTGGTFKIRIGTDETSSANTTAAIAYNATALEVATAIDAVPVAQAYGQTSVWKEGASWLVEFGNGMRVPVFIESNRLSPVSFVRILAQEMSGGWVHEFRPTQAPVATATLFHRVLPDEPKVTVLKHGYVDQYDLAPRKYPTVQRLFIGEAFRGLYTLRYGNLKTGLLDPVNDGIAAVQREVAAIMGDDVTVTNPGDGIALITFDGDKLNGTDVAALEVDVSNAPPGDIAFDLPLNSYELFSALRGKASITLPFEVEVEMVDSQSDENNPDVESIRQTLWSTTITLKQELNWAGLEERPQVEWLRPPQHETYIPFTPSQIITGQQSYVTPVGDGVSTDCIVTHGLGTKNVQVTLRNNDETGSVFWGFTDFAEDDDVVRLHFNDGPAPALGYIATIVAAGPKSVFQAHTHTMAQIVGLQDALSSLQTTVAALSAVAGVAQEKLNLQPLGDPVFAIPDMAELLPDGFTPTAGAIAGQVMATATGVAPTPAKFAVVGGGDEAKKIVAQAAEATATAAAKVPTVEFVVPAFFEAYPMYAAIVSGTGIASAKYSPAATNTTRRPALLAAIRQTGTPQTVADIASSTALSGAVVAAGTAITLPSYGGRKATKLAAGRFFRTDGRCFYGLAKYGDGYYPDELEKTLFTLPIEAAMLAGGRALEVLFAVDLLLVNSNVTARYTVMLELGRPTASTGPADGVQSVAWSALLEQGVSVSALRAGHSFGASFAVSGGALAAKVKRYGSWEGVDVASGGTQFMLRARLCKFDVEDSTDARGVVVAEMPSFKSIIA